MDKKTIIKNILYTIGVVLAIILFFQKDRLERDFNESRRLIEALGDSLQVWKDKDSISYGRISVLETSRVEDFLALKSKDEEITRLQSEVERYKAKLRDQGSVTTIITETKIDTSWVFLPPSGDTIILSQSILVDTLKNEWIDITFGFVKGFSLLSINNIRNEYTVAIGRESQGIFKPDIPFVEITSYNPYTNIQSLRTYQVSLPPPKRWGLGLQTGYGLYINNSQIHHGLYIGAGISYNFIKW